MMGMAQAHTSVVPFPDAATAADGTAMISADAARALLESLERTAVMLADVIDRESDLLASGHAPAIADLQGDKAELSASYLSDMARLKRHAAEIKALVPDEVARIKPKLQEFGAKLVHNQNALAAVLSVSERLIRTATMKAMASENGLSTYGSGARPAAPAPRAHSATLDRQL